MASPTSTIHGALDTTRVAGAARLPLDLLEDASKRLGYYSLLWAGLIAFWLVTNNFIRPLISPTAPLDDAFPIPGNPVAAVVILLSVALFLYTRWHACDCQLSLDLGLGYEIVLAFAIGLVSQWTPNGSGMSVICMVVLLHPMIVPNTPGKIVVAGFVAASMDPIGVAIAGLRGQATPSVALVLWTYLPNYVCAILAVLPSQIFTRLGRQVQHARELGSYQLGELLGKGGMGEIYKAHHRMLRRPAAVKLIRRDAIDRGGEPAETVVARFKREANAAASLHSPHTIALYDFGVTNDGHFYYVMELLKGLDLEDMVERFGPMPASRAVYLLAQVSHSLAEAHATGLIHRDIKPANLYACRVGIEADFMKVLDFGLVKAAPERGQAQTKLTGGDIAAGTPAYMAPELALGDEAVQRSDIYAVGCVAYWLLTGRLVFEAKTPMKMMMAHINDVPTPPSKHCELEIAQSLDELVMACLEKRPENRPATAEQLREALMSCDVGESWSAIKAEGWWSANLPEFGPPTVSVLPEQRD